MNDYKLNLTKQELQTLDTLLLFSLWDIQKQFKKLGTHDYDLKESYWLYRKTCNDIRERLKMISK